MAAIGWARNQVVENKRAVRRAAWAKGRKIYLQDDQVWEENTNTAPLLYTVGSDDFKADDWESDLNDPTP